MAPERSCSSRTICSIFVEDPLADRQPGIDAGRLLPDQAGAEHQPMRDDLGFLRRLAKDRQEVAGKAHGRKDSVQGVRNRVGSQTARARKDKPFRPVQVQACQAWFRRRPCEWFGPQRLLSRCKNFGPARTNW